MLLLVWGRLDNRMIPAVQDFIAGLEQRHTTGSGSAANRRDHCHPNLVRAAPPLRSNMIFGKTASPDRSGLAHLVRDEGVAGSNPATSTIKTREIRALLCNHPNAVSTYRDSYWDRNVMKPTIPEHRLHPKMVNWASASCFPVCRQAHRLPSKEAVP
jgi:hypothetical protein